MKRTNEQTDEKADGIDKTKEGSWGSTNGWMVRHLRTDGRKNEQKDEEKDEEIDAQKGRKIPRSGLLGFIWRVVFEQVVA